MGTEFQTMQKFREEQDQTGDSKFIASMEDCDGGAIDLYVLDSYHQGVCIALLPDGTYHVHPCGG